MKRALSLLVVLTLLLSVLGVTAITLGEEETRVRVYFVVNGNEVPGEYYGIIGKKVKLPSLSIPEGFILKGWLPNNDLIVEKADQVFEAVLATVPVEEPAAAEQPEAPVAAEQPEAPVAAEQPEAPAAEQPEEPAAPAEEPEAPAAEQPEEPAAPAEEVAAEEQPEQPAAEEQPEAPAAEEQPEAPAAEEQPEAPAAEEQPEAPAAEEQPEAPAAEEQPEAPAEEQPEAPAEDPEVSIEETVNNKPAEAQAEEQADPAAEQPEAPEAEAPAAEGEEPKVLTDADIITEDQLPDNARLIAELLDEMNAERTIGIYASYDGDKLHIGDTVTLIAVLKGYENCTFTAQWQHSKDDANWSDMAGEQSLSSSFEVTKENYADYWRIQIHISAVEIPDELLQSAANN